MNTCSQLNQIIKRYIVVTDTRKVKHREPPIRKKPDDQSTPNTSVPRTCCVIHALARAHDDTTRLYPEQTLPQFSGCHVNISKLDEKSQVIYYMTYPKPHRKTISYDIPCKLEKSIKEKNDAFCNNCPDYVFIVELKSGNAELFSKILPFMGAFHIQMSFIYTI